MAEPLISDHISTRKPSAIRDAQIRFANRKDKIEAVNVAIGNVSLPMHPKMQEAMNSLQNADDELKKGVVRYSSTVGLAGTKNAFLNSISALGFETNSLYSQITDGASHAMELSLLATAGNIDGKQRPVLLIDPAYTNYTSMAKRLGIKTVSITRELKSDGTFTLPDMQEIEEVIENYSPSAMVIIPYDNPTGQFFSQEQINDFSSLAEKYNMWIISDEAYRPLQYTDQNDSSIWGVDSEEIIGRRISLESASKVFNGCGLRIGALITNNKQLHQKLVFENTANLCSPYLLRT